jgi:TnpA family transposase
MVRSQARPKLMLLRSVEFLQSPKIEIPSVATLTDCIAHETRQHQRHLADALAARLSTTQRTLLDALLEKVGPGDEPASPWQRYRVTLLKRFSQSVRPSRIKANLNDLRTLRDLYGQLDTVAELLDLTQEGIRYYATSVLKSQVFQIGRRADEDRHLPMVCFVTHQYYRLQETLVDVLLTCVQTLLNTCKREHKERFYVNRLDRQRSVTAFAEVVHQGMCTPLTHIEQIAFCDQLAAEEKVYRIQDVLRTGKPQRVVVEQQGAHWSDPQSDAAAEAEYYNLLETRSLKLQNRVAELVKEVNFSGDEHTNLMVALRSYQAKNGAIEQGAPVGFLDPQEQQQVVTATGKLRVSLYKTLLFSKLAEAVKAGALNVRHSYKYRSLDDYLLPQDTWHRTRQEYLDRAGLTVVADCPALLASLAETLDAQFCATNQRILAGENPHLTFHPDESWHVFTPKTDTEEAGALSSVFPESRYISLLEVLATVNRLSGFVDEFQHWQVRHNRAKPPARTFFAGILGYGCFIGTRKMARISTGMNEAELENTVHWYFSLDNVHAANDRILRLMDQLALPEIYRAHPGRLHTSSDGQKFEVAVDSLNANYSFKYFGHGRGVSPYSFIDERHFHFHSTVISSAEREAAYVIDGLMHNDVVKSDIHSTDTHGYSEAVFAVTHLLGFTFAPRIKNLAKQSRSSFPQRRRKAYEHQGFRILPDGYIDTHLIAEHWEDILRFVATIKLKETTASQLFKRLNSYSKQHPLWQALKEFGKVIKTRFILGYLDDVAFRQAIEKQLNKGESSNKFSRAISFGNNQEFLYGEKVEQEIAESCRRLIKNAIVCWNYVFLSHKIAQESNEQHRQALIDAVRAGSVVTWHHINLHGEYDFSDEKLQDSVGLHLPTKLAREPI